MPLLLATIFAAIYSGCTENPFSNDKVTGGSRQVSGTVRLGDGQSAEGVYIWLDGFNLGSRADGSGRFQLTLPPRSSQGGDINGVFNLYFYAANYRLANSEAVVRSGEFAYDQGDINKNGELARAVVLAKFLRIVTAVSPATINSNALDSVVVTVRLEAATGDTVTVAFPGLFSDGLAKALLKKSGSNEVVLLYSNKFGFAASDLQVVNIGGFSRIVVFNLRGASIPPGDYEVIPYLLVKHEAVPRRLIEKLGSHVETFGKDYLQIPFRREGGSLKVL
ncbi:MAG: hypothetical protein ACREOI_16280 [bacterium]